MRQRTPRSVLSPHPSSLITYWQVLTQPSAPRRFFLHGLDEAGNLISQHDSLDAPAVHWQPGDVLVQFHEVAVGDAAPVQLRLGVYNPDSCTPGPCQNVLVDGERPFLIFPIE